MAAPRVERRLAAILAADVVGYSRLMERDEQGTLERLKAHRKELVEPLLAEHRGRVVKLMGDGVLCEFPSVVDAVACAVAIQRGMAGRETDVPEAERIRLRIGINTGDVIIEGDDIYGDGVNIAARLEGLAEPGGVCVSGKVREELRRRLDLAFAPMGAQRVKNIAEPVETWRVVLDGSAPAARKLLPRRPGRARAAIAAALALLLLVPAAAAGAWWWLGRGGTARAGGPPLPDRPSLAVLPFDDLGGDARQERLADGFAEDLIAELARFRSLLVIARNSSFAYEGKAVDLRQVGRELGVRYVLEGSLRADDERVRVTTQLIDAATGAHVWSERYDRPAREFFALRDEVVGQIAATLTGSAGPLNRAGEEVAQRKPPASLEAYDHYLLANAAWNRGGREDRLEARRLAEQAIARDPGLAGAHFILAWSLFFDALEGWSADRAAAWARFHEVAAACAAADPLEGRCQVVLGMSHFTKGETGLGAAAFDHALALSPNDAQVLQQVGTQLAIALGTERAREAVELVRRAHRLDPLHPPSHWVGLSYVSYFAGEYEHALETFAKVPRPAMGLEARLYAALAYAQLGRGAEAAAQAAEVLREQPGFSAEAWVDNDFFQPGGSSAALFLDGARKAGLPICATAEAAARFEPGNRLPECEAERAKVAAPKT
jgi:TolB-like protein/class 3 adenylate cyclase/cytochrome c-type biogenesis protein CcmH/NrfG